VNLSSRQANDYAICQGEIAYNVPECGFLLRIGMAGLNRQRQLFRVFKTHTRCTGGALIPFLVE
jgi:hypothetical protein